MLAFPPFTDWSILGKEDGGGKWSGMVMKAELLDLLSLHDEYESVVVESTLSNTSHQDAKMMPSVERILWISTDFIKTHR